MMNGLLSELWHRVQDLAEEEGCLLRITAALSDPVKQRVLHLCAIHMCVVASIQLQPQPSCSVLLLLAVINCRNDTIKLTP